MSKIIKVIDEEMDHPLDYRIVDSGRGNDIKRFIPEPGTNNLNIATPVDRELLEQIQKNGVYEVETVHTVNSSSIDIYNCAIEGLNDFGIYEKIFIKVLIDMPNEFNQPKLKLNDVEYALLYKPENEDYKPLDAGMLKAGQFYNLVFNGSQFIVENGSLPATPDNAGISSESDWRKIVSELSGATYSGIFGTELKSIKTGESYVYIENGKGTVYLACKDATNPTGFLIPDTANFYNLSSVYTKKEIDRLIRTKEVATQTYPGLGDSKFIRIGKVCFFSMFLQGAGFSLTDGHIITPFPTNFYPDNSFLLPRPAEFAIESNFTDSNANLGRIVFGSTGPQIYGVGSKTITELKGTITYINNL